MHRNLRVAARNLRDVVRTLRAQRVRLDHILRGGELGLNADAYAGQIGSWLHPSTPLFPSPHSELLDAFESVGIDVLEKERFHETRYYLFGKSCIENLGRFFTAYNDSQIVDVARVFLQNYSGERLASARPVSFGCFSGKWSSPIVRRVLWSDHYQVIDGQHRLAMAYARGQLNTRVFILSEPTLTPLQRVLLADQITLGKSRVLHQPLGFPEVSQWKVRQGCDWRMERIAPLHL